MYIFIYDGFQMLTFMFHLQVYVTGWANRQIYQQGKALKASMPSSVKMDTRQLNTKHALTHCLLMPFETHRQITVEANVAGGYIDTGNINVSINLLWMLSDQLCKS